MSLMEGALRKEYEVLTSLVCISSKVLYDLQIPGAIMPAYALLYIERDY